MRDLRPPLTNIVHCLLNLPLGFAKSELFPNSALTKVVQHIIDTLNRSVPQDTESIGDVSLDENLSPVISLLSSIYDVAPDTVKDTMKQNLLPTEKFTRHQYQLTF